MRKALNRILFCALGSLLAFTGVNFPFSITSAKSEELIYKAIIENNIIMEDYPNVLTIDLGPNINNYSGSFYNLRFIILSVNFNETILPVLENNVTVTPKGIPEDQPNDRPELFPEYNESRTRIYKEFFNTHKYSPDRNWVGCTEIIEPFTRDVYGIIIDSELVINENFFSKGDRVKEISLNWMNIQELEKFLGIDLYNYDLSPSVFEGLKNNRTRIYYKDFIDFYLKIVPKQYWPQITVDKINVNTTLPNIKDEILNKKIDENDHLSMALSFFETTDGKRKCTLVRYEKNNDAYDIFTGELWVENSKPTNVAYLNDLNVSSEYMDMFDGKIINRMLFIKEPLGIEYFTFFDEKYWKLADEFANAETYGDYVKLYQKLPLEEQIDYSFYDFSRSPSTGIDPAWLANRPTPGPTPVPTPKPTLAPYAELRVGSSGQEVMDMKQRFFEMGYFRTSEFNDRFSENTADTVKLFEKNNGLPVDGIADAVTLSVLFSDSAVGK